MSKSILRLLAVAAITALVLPGCKDSGVGNGDSAGMNTFLSRFSEETSGNGGGGDNTTQYRVGITGGTMSVEGIPVQSGTSFYQGEVVSIRADTTTTNLRGQVFSHWTATPTSVTFNDRNAASTTFRMPATNVTITANFRYDTLTDSRDGQKYRIVRIGGKTWMAKNLNYAGQTSGNSWCYMDSTSYCDKYGRLYDWEAAKSACQGIGNGWRLPTEQDWNALVSAVGSSAGTKLKSEVGWNTSDVYYFPLIPGTDQYGFSALPGGGRWFGNFYDVGYYGFFGSVGYYGNWWSATEDDSEYVQYWYMISDGENVDEFWDNKSNGFSARCLRD